MDGERNHFSPHKPSNQHQCDWWSNKNVESLLQSLASVTVIQLWYLLQTTHFNYCKQTVKREEMKKKKNVQLN